MPFRTRFDCLWCGQDYSARDEGSLEGWSSLCPDCLGRADSNGFLRARLRSALSERAAAMAGDADAAGRDPSVEEGQAVGERQAVGGPAGGESEAGGKRLAVGPGTAGGQRPEVDADARSAPGTAGSPTDDDWYLRRGRFAGGPLLDGPWQMELDEVTRWLDALPLAGTIVELAGGSGWWTPLLASKGETWVYDVDGPSLDAARRRLVAHGLRAHLHERDPLARADRSVDVVFCAYLLGAAADGIELQRRLEVATGWLKPGGQLVVIEAAPLAGREGSLDGPRGPLWPREVATWDGTLREAGLEPVELRQPHRSFVVGRAVVPDRGVSGAP